MTFSDEMHILSLSHDTLLSTFLLHGQSAQCSFAAYICVQCIVSASRYSADLGCSQWLNELLLPFCGLQPVFLFWPLTLDINKTLPTTQLPPTGYFLFRGSSSVNTRDGCAGVKFPVGQQQFAKHSHHFLLMNLVVSGRECGILLLFCFLPSPLVTVK